MGSFRLGQAGMRGEIASALIPELAINFASALGTYLEGGTVVVGRDTRISSPLFHKAAISALMSCGCDVIDAGIISAPEIHYIVPKLKAKGGLLIGAGHHPMGWNALIPILENGAFFTNVKLQELLDIYHSKRYLMATWDKIGKIKLPPNNFQEEYLDMLCSKLDIKAIAAKNFMVIADFCNGAGSSIGIKFAERLGINLLAINKANSGFLPHDPEPRPRSALQTNSVLKPLNADIGFVFNSDMSRTSIVTSSGETLSEEYTFPLVLEHVLQNSDKKLKIVTNWCTTKSLDDIAKKYDAQVFKTTVGESSIIDKMNEISADIAGDGSGSVAFANHIMSFDNLMVMGVILEAMAKQRCTSAELASSIPRYNIIKKKVSCPSSHAYNAIKGFKIIFTDAEVLEEDGFLFKWKDGSVHLRSSTTEPIIRMIVEFKSKEKAEDKAIQIRGLLDRFSG